MIAIIPARSGSKRIKNKNIKKFKGKPIIYWIIQKLKKNKFIKKIVVTSDSDKILKISKKCGADVLIKRPKKISEDRTPVQSAVKDAILRLNKKEKISDEDIIVIFPCSVFFQNIDIYQGLKMLSTYQNKFVIRVSKYTHPIQRAYYLKNDHLIYLDKKNELKRTQDLKETYYDAGQFYIGKFKTWLKKKLHSNSLALYIPNRLSIDIDNLEDWKLAEKIFVK